jgi:quercetin dioxygenase-like cupin family protein
MGLVLVGEIEATIGDATKTLKKGDMYHVPSDITHGGKTHIEKAIVLDTYSPPRDDNI